jgi:hypothetical protein
MGTDTAAARPVVTALVVGDLGHRRWAPGGQAWVRCGVPRLVDAAHQR